MTEPVRNWYTRCALAVVPLCGVVVTLAITRHGEYLDPDSLAYIAAASNLLHGHGVTTPFELSESTLSPIQALAFRGAIPLNHFPPLYPVVLAAISWFGLSIIEGARWLSAILFGANLLLFELILRRFTRSGVLVPVAGALLLVADQSNQIGFLGLHLFVLSEPLGIFFVLLTILLVDKYLDTPTVAIAIGIAVCLAAAPLNRYVDFSLVIGAAAIVLLWAPLSWTRRWHVAGWLTVAGVVPSALWSVFVSATMGGGSVRTLAWHPNRDIVQATAATASAWIFPSRIPSGARELLLAGVLVLCGIAFVVHHRRFPERSPSVVHILAIVVFAAAYLLAVWLSRDFLDALISVSNRMLSPLIPMLFLLVITAVISLFRNHRTGVLVTSALCLVFVLVSVHGVVEAVEHPPNTGRQVYALPIMRAIRDLPEDTLIATRTPDVVYMATGRTTIRVPVFVEPLTQRVNPQFSDQTRQLAQMLIRRHGLLVEIPQGDENGRLTAAWPANFKLYATLTVEASYPHGDVIYRLGPLAGSQNVSADGAS